MLADNPRAALEANELSLVLALAVTDAKARFNALLAADADTDSIERAIRLWRSHAAERKIDTCFQAVKVSHHGSIHNHSEELCNHGPHPDGATKVAAISAGQRDALPDRHVIEEYVNAGWSVLTTTTRKGPPKNRVADLHFKRTSPTTFQESTIALLWQDDGTFLFQPNTSAIGKDDIAAYATAKK